MWKRLAIVVIPGVVYQMYSLPLKRALCMSYWLHRGVRRRKLTPHWCNTHARQSAGLHATLQAEPWTRRSQVVFVVTVSLAVLFSFLKFTSNSLINTKYNLWPGNAFRWVRMAKNYDCQLSNVSILICICSTSGRYCGSTSLIWTCIYPEPLCLSKRRYPS